MPIHIMSTYFVTKLCYWKGELLLDPKLDEMDRWTSRKYLCKVDEITECEKSVINATATYIRGALDIFKCRRVIFPVNVSSVHWIMFSVNPRSLRIVCFDSLHCGINKWRQDVTHNIYRWMLYEHQQRHGRAHAKVDKTWDPGTCVLDGQSQGTTKQRKNDCGLHVCLVSLLLQQGLKLDVPVFGRKGSANAITEVRRRMVLTFERGIYMFQRKQAVNLDHVACVGTRSFYDAHTRVRVDRHLEPIVYSIL
jgi:hypothetical protein